MKNELDRGVHPSRVLSWSDLLDSVRRRKKVVLGFMAASVAAAVLLAIAWPKTYRSEAKLYVRLGRENVGLDATASMSREIVGLQITREEELNTHVELLRSRALLEKVIDAVGPNAILNATVEAESKDAPVVAGFGATVGESVRWLTNSRPLTPRERAFNTVNRQLDVQNVRKTDVIVVAHEGPNAALSQRIVDSLINSYLDEHMRISRPPGAHAFLERQAAAVKASLCQKENELRAFKDATGLASPVEQRQTLVNQIGRMEDDLKSTGALTAATEAENRALINELSKLAPIDLVNKSTGNTNYAADGMRQQLYTLQLREKELASRVTDQHVELRSVRAQIAAATPILDSIEQTRTQTITGPNRAYEELRLTLLKQKAALASHRAKSSTLQAQLAEARQQLRSLNDNEMRVAQLERESQILDGSYRKYADSLEHARLDESLERQRISNISVAQSPSLSLQPVRPQRSFFLFFGLVVAACGAPLVAVAADALEATAKARKTVPAPAPAPALAATRINVPAMAPLPAVREAHSIGNAQA